MDDELPHRRPPQRRSKQEQRHWERGKCWSANWRERRRERFLAPCLQLVAVAVGLKRCVCA
jgi:hypothetical protein